MDLESLRIFSTVAAELSITQASTKLGRVPSNVTTRIQQLEADLGVEVFMRTGKRLSLSIAGERFLEYAQRLLALAEEARQSVGGNPVGGTLHIGSMESTAASRLPNLLAAYHTRFAETRLEVTTGPSRGLLEQVTNARLDCAFVALPPALSNDQALRDLGLSACPVWQEKLLLLLPSTESDVSHAAQVRTRSLAAFKAGCTYRSLAEEHLGIAGDLSWRVQEIGSYHAMIACVAAGTSVALLPESVVQLAQVPHSLPRLTLGYMDTHLVWRSQHRLPAFDNLLQQVEQQT